MAIICFSWFGCKFDGFLSSSATTRRRYRYACACATSILLFRDTVTFTPPHQRAGVPHWLTGDPSYDLTINISSIGSTFHSCYIDKIPRDRERELESKGENRSPSREQHLRKIVRVLRLGLWHKTASKKQVKAQSKTQNQKHVKCNAKDEHYIIARLFIPLNCSSPSSYA